MGKKPTFLFMLLDYSVKTIFNFGKVVYQD